MKVGVCQRAFFANAWENHASRSKIRVTGIVVQSLFNADIVTHDSHRTRISNMAVLWLLRGCGGAPDNLDLFLPPTRGQTSSFPHACNIGQIAPALGNLGHVAQRQKSWFLRLPLRSYLGFQTSQGPGLLRWLLTSTPIHAACGVREYHPYSSLKYKARSSLASLRVSG